MLFASFPHKGLISWCSQAVNFIVFSHKTKCPCLLRVTGCSGIFDGWLGGVPPWLWVYKVPVSVVSQCCHLLSGRSERSYPKLWLQSGIRKLAEKLRRCCSVLKSVIVSGGGKNLSLLETWAKGEDANCLVDAKFSLGTARDDERNSQSLEAL